MNTLLPKMMCYFVARTNWLNIKSNYFMHSIIVLNLPYNTNVMITVTFVNQVTLSHTFLLFPPDNYHYPHKSGAIFQVDLYVFDMHTKIPNGTHKLHHVKRLAVFQDKPFTIPYGGMNHLHCYWNKRMLAIIQITFKADVLDGFLLSMNGLSSVTWLPFSSVSFGLGPLFESPFAAVMLDGFLLLM
jgi:hypothetical protein